MARFDSVYAFRYNSAKSEPIWIKYGALLSTSSGLAVADFWRDLLSNESESSREPGEILFFFVT